MRNIRYNHQFFMITCQLCKSIFTKITRMYFFSMDDKDCTISLMTVLKDWHNHALFYSRYYFYNLWYAVLDFFRSHTVLYIKNQQRMKFLALILICHKYKDCKSDHFLSQRCSCIPQEQSCFFRGLYVKQHLVHKPIQ